MAPAPPPPHVKAQALSAPAWWSAPTNPAPAASEAALPSPARSKNARGGREEEDQGEDEGITGEKEVALSSPRDRVVAREPNPPAAVAAAAAKLAPPGHLRLSRRQAASTRNDSWRVEVRIESGLRMGWNGLEWPVFIPNRA